MSKRKVLGQAICPECESADCEIREQGNGLAYRYCFDCGAQYFSRTPAASERLLATMKNGNGRPVAVAAGQPAEPEPPASQPASQPAEETPPASRSEVTRTARPGLSLFGRGAS